jgi:hypothetical protein
MATKRRTIELLWFGLLLLLVTGIWATYPWWIRWLASPLWTNEVANYGQMGDSFGALNSLFAGLAFAGIIVSIWLQSRELHETREELRGQKEALQRQVFESSFFNLLNHFSEAISSLEFRAEGETKRGREAVEHAGRFFVKTIGIYIPQRVTLPSIEYYEHVYAFDARYVWPYFYRNLYEVLIYLDRAPNSERDQYARIIKAQLSDIDTIFLYLHGLSQVGKEKFKPLIEKYALLEYLPHNVNFPLPSVQSYAKSAFGADLQWQRKWDEKQ